MKILVRLPNALGDMVMGTAFIAALYQQFPQVIVHVILKKEIAEVAELIPHPVVIHQFSKKEYRGLSGLYRFGKNLSHEKFDVVFCLPESISSAVMCWATNAKQKIGFYSTINLLLFTKTYPRPKRTHRVIEYISLLEQYNKQKISSYATELVAQKTLTEELVLLNFNSEAISRKMPTEKAKSLLADLAIQFPNTKFGLIGSPKEVSFIEDLIQNCSPNFISYAGKTTVKSLASLMKTAKFMLSTDSGPAHLANSLGLPLLVLFGAGDETNTAPFNKQKLHILRLGKLKCEPCVKNICMYGSPKCIELLENRSIINVFSAYLTN